MVEREGFDELLNIDLKEALGASEVIPLPSQKSGNIFGLLIEGAEIYERRSQETLKVNETLIDQKKEPNIPPDK